MLSRKLDLERSPRKTSAAVFFEMRRRNRGSRSGPSEVEAERKGIDELIEACAQGKVDEAKKLLDAGRTEWAHKQGRLRGTPPDPRSAADKPEGGW